MCQVHPLSTTKPTLRVPLRKGRSWRGEFRRCRVAIRTRAGVAMGDDMRSRRVGFGTRAGSGLAVLSTGFDARTRRVRGRRREATSKTKSCKRSSQSRTKEQARKAADDALRSATDVAIEANPNAGRSRTSDGCNTSVALRGSDKPRIRWPRIQYV
eukprot:2340592-Pleurochrysis_carterae.AAC.1